MQDVSEEHAGRKVSKYKISGSLDSAGDTTHQRVEFGQAAKVRFMAVTSVIPSADVSFCQQISWIKMDGW